MKLYNIIYLNQTLAASRYNSPDLRWASLVSPHLALSIGHEFFVSLSCVIIIVSIIMHKIIQKHRDKFKKFIDGWWQWPWPSVLATIGDSWPVRSVHSQVNAT